LRRKALKILRKVSEIFSMFQQLQIFIINEDAAMAAQNVDVLQISAFLVRQTDLVVAAATQEKRSI
jgi:2-dehydro-3-deoxyphosphooctonate aldolase (KDO 8-P synthase)